MYKVVRLAGFAAFFMLSLAFLTTATTKEVSANPAYCDAEVDELTNENFQDEVPVILVHGLSGDSDDWGSPNNSSDFAGVVNDIPGVEVAHLFDYYTHYWVDNGNSGPALAKTIDCVSQLSTNNGGKGKVIVIGYSMGGLAARDALSRLSSDGQRAIADQVGQVITIATPHEGAITTPIEQLTPIGSALTPGSDELEELPSFPSQTIVHSIAADVTRVYVDLFGNEESRQQPHDDLRVSVASALSEYSTDDSIGGGQTTFYCDKEYHRNFLGWYDEQSSLCEHGNLLSYASTRWDTEDAIEKYVAWLNTPNYPSLTVGNLTTYYDENWTDLFQDTGYGQAKDTTNSAPCTNCSTTPPPDILASVQVVDYSFYCSYPGNPILTCAIESATILGSAPSVTIGGRTPSHAVRYEESGGYDGTALVWCFEDEYVCVHYRRGTDTPQIEMSQALLDVFETATWSET